MRLNKIIKLILLLSVALSQSKNAFNGFLDFNYISRTSDGSIINLPYRLFSLKIDHENEDILIKSNLETNEKVKNAIQFLANQFINNGSIENSAPWVRNKTILILDCLLWDHVN